MGGVKMKRVIAIIVILFTLACTKVDHYKKGEELFESGHYRQAIEQFNQVHSDSRAYPEAQRYINGCNTMLKLDRKLKQ